MRLPRSAAGVYCTVEPGVPSEHDAVHFEKDASVPCCGSLLPERSMSQLLPGKGLSSWVRSEKAQLRSPSRPEDVCVRGIAYRAHHVRRMNDALCTKSNLREQVKRLTSLLLINIHLAFIFSLEKTAEIFFLSGSTAGIRANEQPGGPFAGRSFPHSASSRSSSSK